MQIEERARRVVENWLADQEFTIVGYRIADEVQKAITKEITEAVQDLKQFVQKVASLTCSSKLNLAQDAIALSNEAKLLLQKEIK